MSKQYSVFFADSDVSVEFDNLQDARHYARMNGGMVWDNIKWQAVYDYRVEGLDY